MDIELLKMVMGRTHLKLISPRAVYGPLTWQRESLPVIDLANLGFSPASKMKQLKRNYFNPEAAEVFRKKRQGRRGQSYTSLTFYPHGETKVSRSMGFCMNAIVLTEFNHHQSVTVQYRTTELLSKFHADMHFLPWVFDQLEIVPQLITFQLANAFLSGCFLPSLFTQFDPDEFYEWTSKNADPKLHYFFARYFWKRYQDPKKDLGYSAAKRQHALAWKHPEVTRRALRWIEANVNVKGF